MKWFKIFFILMCGALVGFLAQPLIESVLPVHAQPEPNMRSIYSAAAQHESEFRNPVIVIPGMMGSKLAEVKTGRVLWGAFTATSIDPSVAADTRLLSYPIDGDFDFYQVDDGVAATGVLDTLKIELAGLSLNHQAYLNILKMLGVGGYRDEELGLSGAVDYGGRHFTCFQFPYDWRRDNAENARRLHEFILQRQAEVQATRRKMFNSNEPVKFDIVAHSMGGLVARYYLRYGDQGPPTNGQLPLLDWSGAEFVDRLIMIGTPNDGSAKSLKSVHEGFSFSALLTKFPSGLVATLPSIYQLLPHGHQPFVFDSVTGQPLDVLDVDVWAERGWGLLNPEADPVLQQLLPDVDDASHRFLIAKGHLTRCLDGARYLFAALDVPASPPEGLSIHLFAGDTIPTLSRLNSNQRLRTFVDAGNSPGDGTVIRQSALADQRTPDAWTPILNSPIDFRDVRFLSGDHFGITRNVEFTDNALFLLLEDPTKNRSTARRWKQQTGRFPGSEPSVQKPMNGKPMQENRMQVKPTTP